MDLQLEFGDEHYMPSITVGWFFPDGLLRSELAAEFAYQLDLLRRIRVFSA